MQHHTNFANSPAPESAIYGTLQTMSTRSTRAHMVLRVYWGTEFRTRVGHLNLFLKSQCPEHNTSQYEAVDLVPSSL